MRVDPTGERGPTRGQVAGPYWRRTAAGQYVPGGVTIGPVEQRIVEEAARLPGGGAVTGWASCRLQGAAFLDGLGVDGVTPLDVPLVVPPASGMRRRRGVAVARERLPWWEWWIRCGVPVTRPERAVFDEMRRVGDPVEAVVVVEMAYAAAITSPRRMWAFLVTHRRYRGRSLVTCGLARASQHSRSPQESRLRLFAGDQLGWTGLLINCPIIGSSGALIGIADLLDPVAGLVVEFDGAEHRGLARHSKDVEKEDRLRRCGVEVTRVTGSDLWVPGRVRARLELARGRALFEPVASRAWVARPPADDLDERLDLRDQDVMHREWAEVESRLPGR